MTIHTPTDYTDEELQALLGKSLLVGITHCDVAGKTTSLEQFYGTICRIALQEGVTVKLHNTETERTIPLVIENFEVARLGQYCLTNTGEVVENPDYIATWTENSKG